MKFKSHNMHFIEQQQSPVAMWHYVVPAEEAGDTITSQELLEACFQAMLTDICADNFFVDAHDMYCGDIIIIIVQKIFKGKRICRARMMVCSERSVDRVILSPLS